MPKLKPTKNTPLLGALFGAWESELYNFQRSDAMERNYEITSRPVELGGGWRLRLLEGGEEVGGGVFPVEDGNPQQGVDWWNWLQEPERAHWLAIAKSAVPADAWVAYLRSGAYADADATAHDWLDSRG